MIQNHALKYFRALLLLVAGLLFAIQTPVKASSETENQSKEKFDIGEMIFHHISDAHEWHFWDGATLYLPVILYTPDRGIEVFNFHHFHNEASAYDRYHYSHGHFAVIGDESNHPIDLSITKNVASLLLSALILLLVFLTVAKGYGRSLVPSGIRGFMEPLVLFVRDEIARANISHGADKFVPYLLTVFFFIWVNNLLGLIPGGANLTGNIAVTLVLSLATLLITLFSAKKYYWAHIFTPPGVPLWLYPIMVPVEIIGIFTKPFSLMIRLFANITAGHIIILSLLGLIFIFKSFAVGPVSVAFSVFMNFLELLVAFLQAYVFTLLSAMYIGGAVEEHHH